MHFYSVQKISSHQWPATASFLHLSVTVKDDWHDTLFNQPPCLSLHFVCCQSIRWLTFRNGMMPYSIINRVCPRTGLHRGAAGGQVRRLALRLRRDRGGRELGGVGSPWRSLGTRKLHQIPNPCFQGNCLLFKIILARPRALFVYWIRYISHLYNRSHYS